MLNKKIIPVDVTDNTIKFFKANISWHYDNWMLTRIGLQYTSKIWTHCRQHGL